MNLWIEILFALLRRFLKGGVLGALILFVGLSSIGCASVSREEPKSFKVGEAPWEIESKVEAEVKDDTPEILRNLTNEQKLFIAEQVARSVKETFEAGYDQGKKENDLILREILLPLARTHIATHERHQECLAIYKAGRGNFPNAETEVDCLVTQRRVKDADSWLKYYEELQEKGLIVVTDTKGGSNE